MTEGNFVDYIKIYASSGKGGQGSAHLHREKYITKGGPDGGDGGRGGHIILRGDKNMWTLFHLKFKRHFRAEGGGAGSKSRSSGADGEDSTMKTESVQIAYTMGSMSINAYSTETSNPNYDTDADNLNVNEIAIGLAF